MRALPLIACLVFVASAAQAQEPSILNPSGLPVPRFVSLKSEPVNARVGPGKRYPIRWVYQRKQLPVAIVEEFANWRKISDHDGQGGWVNKALLSGTRTAIVQGDFQHLYRRADASSRPVLRVGKGVILTLQSCEADWCHAQISEHEGWIRKADIWGVKREEVF